MWSTVGTATLSCARLRIQECARSAPVQPKPASGQRLSKAKAVNAGGKSEWMRDFQLKTAPPLRKAIIIANATGQA